MVRKTVRSFGKSPAQPNLWSFAPHMQAVQRISHPYASILKPRSWPSVLETSACQLSMRDMLGDSFRHSGDTASRSITRELANPVPQVDRAEIGGLNVLPNGEMSSYLGLADRRAAQYEEWE